MYFQLFGVNLGKLRKRGVRGAAYCLLGRPRRLLDLQDGDGPASATNGFGSLPASSSVKASILFFQA